LEDGAVEHAGGEDSAEAQLSAAFHQAPVGMAITRTDGSFVEVNDALCELLGRSRRELKSLMVEDVTYPDDVADVREGRQHMLATGQRRHKGRFRLLHASQRPISVSLTCALLGEPGDRVEGLIFHAADVTQEQQRESELIHRALHDPLTGLPNRVLFLDRLSHAIARLRRGESSVAVLFLDVDDFKTVNDRYGHRIGDDVLAQGAVRLAHAVRPGDTVARFGGDEFVVLCEDSGPSEAAVVARRIGERWQAPIPVPDGGQVTLTCSIGVAVAQRADTTADQLLREADEAMYRVKARRSSR
jgi:diguanylate cyclase (GGDEF)-like protein/PAS domain S-box-containing protein